MCCEEGRKREKKASGVIRVSPLGETQAAPICKGIRLRYRPIDEWNPPEWDERIRSRAGLRCAGQHLWVKGGAPSNVDAVWRQSTKNAGPRAGGYHEIALVPSEIGLEARLEAVRRARDCWTA